MTDKIEIQGKTVDEAVSEALLRMGARRDEVDVTVLEEPKNGFLGLVGGRKARVIVRRRAGGRGPSRGNDFRRDNADHPPHELGSGDGRGGRGRGGRGRGGSRSGGRADSRNEGRSEGRSEGRGEGRGESRNEGRSGRRGEARADGRGDSSRSDGRSRGRGGRGRDGRSETDRPERDAVTAQAQGENRPGGDQQPGEKSGGGRRRRGRRGGRGRSGGGRSQQPAPTGETLERDVRASIAAEQAEFHAQLQTSGELPDVDHAEDASPGNNRDEGRGGSRGGRSRGGRSRGGRGRSRGEDRGDARANEAGGRRPAAQTANGADEPILPAPEATVREERAPAPSAPAGPDEVIATGIKASGYAQPKRGLAEDSIDAGLTELASGMLVRAGFPCRCEVKPGEYRMVKVITDDISAGMLIGRHGQTIDAVEHLVERMASAAAGDRVRMNLDINNYRRRREDALVDRVSQAVAEVRSTERDVHLEPMDARERRIVHLEAALAKGIRTWTVGGPGSKHVVVGIDDGTPREEENEPLEIDEYDDPTAADPVQPAQAAPADGEEQERPGADA